MIIMYCDSGENTEHETSPLGGAFRSISRSFVRLLRLEKVVIGSIPRRLPVQKVAKSADALGQIYDVSSKLYNAHEEIKHPYRKSGNVLSQIRKWIHLTAKATPTIFKSAVLGGILFSTFEKTEAYMDDIFFAKHHDDILGSNIKGIVLPACIAITAGGCSGCLHGLVSAMWDGVGSSLFQRSASTVPRMVLGSMVAHSSVHSVLFGTYELTKRMVLAAFGLHTERDTSRLEGAGCVVLGGLVAGVMAEVVSDIVLPLEEQGLGATLNRIALRSSSSKKLKVLVFNRAYLRGLMPSILSTVLGFVAYEYAKDIHFRANE